MLKHTQLIVFVLFSALSTIALATPSKLTTVVQNAETEIAHQVTVADEASEKAYAAEVAISACVNTLRKTGYVSNENGLLRRYCKTVYVSKNRKLGRLGRRVMAERATELNPFVITPHDMSYIMPVAITDNFNQTPYETFDISLEGDETESTPISDHMSNVETKYQISFKVPLNTGSLFIEGDALYFAMTLQAWWQLYSDDISSPFRETNYKPEIFYLAPLPWKLYGGNLGFALHFEHQSNGQFQALSRSWNRLHLTMLYDTDHWTAALKVWHRLEESEKEMSLSPVGDDNPDIEDYYGNYELKLGYAINDQHKIYTLARKNWRTGNGAIEINYSFPFTGRLRGFAQYFSGYGESLIDYNHKQQKFGVGITLIDIF